MITLEPRTLSRLRARLKERGERPSILALGPEALERADHPFAGDEEAVAQLEALVETMYLMAAADGTVAQAERDVLKGAVRELTEGALRGAHIDRMLDDCAARAIASGVPGRLEVAAGILRNDAAIGEVAFVLAAAVAFADEEVRDEENDLVNALAGHLGIGEARANELLDELETDATS